MTRIKATKGSGKTPATSDLLTRLLSLSSATFIRMVAKSGLPTDEARELNAMFRALKG